MSQDREQYGESQDGRGKWQIEAEALRAQVLALTLRAEQAERERDTLADEICPTRQKNPDQWTIRNLAALAMAHRDDSDTIDQCDTDTARTFIDGVTESADRRRLKFAEDAALRARLAAEIEAFGLGYLNLNTVGCEDAEALELIKGEFLARFKPLVQAALSPEEKTP